MFRSFYKRGILLVFITAVLLGIVLFLVFNRMYPQLLPVKNNTQIAYHYNLSPSEEEVKAESDITDGCLIGNLRGKDVLPLRYHADYAALGANASLENGRINGGSVAYIRIINSNASLFEKTLSVSGVYGTHNYVLAEEVTVAGEMQAKSLPQEGGTVIIYYQKRGDIGLTDQYQALIYKEAN